MLSSLTFLKPGGAAKGPPITGGSTRRRFLDPLAFREESAFVP